MTKRHHPVLPQVPRAATDVVSRTRLPPGCLLSQGITKRPSSAMPLRLVSLECGSYGHDGPPPRPTSLASLALTAPREQRSREICRIAVSFRRAGLLLRRIRIRLNHLPIKMPGGMTEHRQNDSETDEER